MFRSIFRPRSLLQLILTGFVLVTFPLAFLLYQTTISLNYLSTMQENNISAFVQQTRLATQLNFLSVDMVNTIRRYQILQNQVLLDRYVERIRRYETLLEKTDYAKSDTVSQLQQMLPLLNQLFVSSPNGSKDGNVYRHFLELNRQLENEIGAEVDVRNAQVEQQLQHYQHRSWWYLSVLFSFSFILSMIFTWLIMRPIQKMENMIHCIGSGEAPEPVTLTSPTEFVALCRRLYWLHQRLDQLEAQKQQFLRHLSHELKTPLSSLREGADLLIEQVAGPMNESQLEIAELMMDNSVRLQSLIEQLLGYNRLSQQKRSIPSQVDLEAMINEILAQYQLPSQAKGLAIHLAIESQHWYTEADRLRLILDNLISNAIHYGEREIRIEAFAKQQTLILNISNWGPEIPPEERELIFEPFVQGRAVRKGPVRGSGLGLSIAKDLVISLRGELYVVNDHEMDVCFRLILNQIELEVMPCIESYS